MINIEIKEEIAGLPQGNPNSSSATTSYNNSIDGFLDVVNQKPESALPSNISAHLDMLKTFLKPLEKFAGLCYNTKQPPTAVHHARFPGRYF